MNINQNQEYWDMFLSNGDLQAREKLLELNLGLVRKVVNKISVPFEEKDDVYQEGSMGLLKAIDTYNPTQNLMFSTYATHKIMFYISDYLRTYKTFRVPQAIQRKFGSIKLFVDCFSQREKRDPNINEIATGLSCSEEEVMLALGANCIPISMLTPVFQNGVESIGLVETLVSNDISQEEWLENLELKKAFEKLEELEQKIIYAIYFENKRKAQIAAELEITIKEVLKIKSNALKELAKTLTNK